MSKLEMRLVEICEDCGELIEHCCCDNEDACEDCYCDECCECEYNKDKNFTDEENRDYSLIWDCVHSVLNANGCEDCTLRAVMDLFFAAKNIGWSDHQDYIAKCNED